MIELRGFHTRQRSQLLALLFFLTAAAVLVGAASPGRPEVQGATSPAGSIERGQALFMGNVHLENGGPPCMGCHSVGSNGLLGGGALGPDLTNVSSRYSEAALAQALADIPGPTMKPIFSAHPLTPQEQADLLAFLEASAGQPTVNREPLLFALSLGGLAVAAGLFGFLYRKRLRGVRKPLVHRSKSRDRLP